MPPTCWTGDRVVCLRGETLGHKIQSETSFGTSDCAATRDVVLELTVRTSPRWSVPAPYMEPSNNGQQPPSLPAQPFMINDQTRAMNLGPYGPNGMAHNPATAAARPPALANAHGGVLRHAQQPQNVQNVHGRFPIPVYNGTYDPGQPNGVPNMAVRPQQLMPMYGAAQPRVGFAQQHVMQPQGQRPMVPGAAMFQTQQMYHQQQAQQQMFNPNLPAHGLRRVVAPVNPYFQATNRRTVNAVGAPWYADQMPEQASLAAQPPSVASQPQQASQWRNPSVGATPAQASPAPQQRHSDRGAARATASPFPPASVSLSPAPAKKAAKPRKRAAAAAAKRTRSSATTTASAPRRKSAKSSTPSSKAAGKAAATKAAEVVRAKPRHWTQEEDDLLRRAVGRIGEQNWKQIAQGVPGRNHVQCLQRWKKALDPSLVKGPWSEEEDNLLTSLVGVHGCKWKVVAKRINGRNTKQCRERWCNYLDPQLNRGKWTDEEDATMLRMHEEVGNRWAAIAKVLPGRTDNQVKIRYHSLSRKDSNPVKSEEK